MIETSSSDIRIIPHITQKTISTGGKIRVVAKGLISQITTGLFHAWLRRFCNLPISTPLY